MVFLRPLRRLKHAPRLLAAVALMLVVAASFSAATPVKTDGAAYVAAASLPRPTRIDRVVVDRVKINLPIKDGRIGMKLRERVAYHYPGTSWPGGRSNTYLYSHARVGSFLNLWKVRKGDIVRVHLVSGAWVRYKVTVAKKVKWNDGRWTLLTSSERLTLQTCTGNTKTSNRFVVVAVPVK